MALYDNLKNLIAGATLFADTPLGTINAFGGSVAPDGWLMCQGQAVSRTTYADLFAVIGTAFGAGDGSTTFNVPDFRESVPKGAGLTGKIVGAHVSTNGLAVGEFLDDRVQSHTHPYQTSLGKYADGGTARQGNDVVGTWNTSENSGRSGVTTEVKAVGVNFIIKAKQVGIPQDFLTQLEELLDSKQLLSWGNGT